MNKYIINPFTPIPKHPRSHVRGWSDYWARMVKGSILRNDEFFNIKGDDEIYLDHGVNFGGTMNLFGGVDLAMVNRIEMLVKVRPKLFSLDIPMPDYAAQLKKRIGQGTCHESLTVRLLNSFSDYLSTATLMNHTHVATHHITIGDSHATAFAPPDSPVWRMNGKTLHGFTADQSITREIRHWAVTEHVKTITLVFGSVDIRHHLARAALSYLDLTKDLVSRLVVIADKLEDTIGARVYLAAPVPVEYEARKIPKSGYYKGTPYYGDIELRRLLTDTMINHLKSEWFEDQVIVPPREWYEMDPKRYAEEIMELSSSVHIAPVNYRSELGWGPNV
jgi:hypothetical protein